MIARNKEIILEQEWKFDQKKTKKYLSTLQTHSLVFRGSYLAYLICKAFLITVDLSLPAIYYGQQSIC